VLSAGCVGDVSLSILASFQMRAMNSEYQSWSANPSFQARHLGCAGAAALMARARCWPRDVLSTHLFYGVEFDRPFLVLSILAATLTLAVLVPRNQTSQVIARRIELATNLLWRWAIPVALPAGARLRHQVFRAMFAPRGGHVGAPDAGAAGDRS
jgi:predicted membrane protein